MSDTEKAFRTLLDAIDWEANLAKRFEASWFNAKRDERRFRMRVIMALTVELKAIEAVDIHGTGLGQGLIEDVIDGDWDGVEACAGFFLFEDESEEYRARYAPRWIAFRALALGAVAEAKRRSEGNPTVPS